MVPVPPGGPGVNAAHCADLTRSGGEPIHGSAPHVEVWVALEYRGHWGRRAVEESDLPKASRAWLDDVLERFAPARVVLIRRDDRSDGPLTLFVACCREEGSHLSRYELSSYDELPALDAVAWTSQGTVKSANAPGPILVCTNGRRDLCCARFGGALVRALGRLSGVEVWQSSHLGGHRYAATAVLLPEGLVYGLLAPDDAAALIEARRRESLLLDRLRGRSLYTPPAQAAEVLLRRELGDVQLYLVEVRHDGGDRYEARFALADGGERGVCVRRLSVEAVVSCHPEKCKTIDRWEAG